MRREYMTNKDFSRTVAENIGAALFDADFYREAYPDVREAGVDPFEHYMSHGWRERRDPSRTFSTSYYLDSNPDVAAAGIDPLLHYATAGIFEGRRPRPPEVHLDDKALVLRAASVRQQALHWQPVYDIEMPLAFDELRRCLNEAFAHGSEKAVLSLSHDQYVQNVGGVQSIVASEAKALQQQGWTYVHVCPARPLPMLAELQDPAEMRLVLTLNGRRQGVVREADLVQVLRPSGPNTPKLYFVLHHAMGFSPATVLALARICQPSPSYIWTHDFFSLCANPFLLRNNLSFCGAPTPESTACMVCNNGQVRPAHLSAMRQIFEALSPVVLAPSLSAFDFWRAHTDLQASAAHVVPPASLEFEAAAVARRPGPLRVAFIGPPAAHKGWAAFATLVIRHREDVRYEFFRLGVGESKLDGLRSIHIEVTADNPDAMVKALRDHAIDAVVNWYSCFETFSFSTHEAMAAGAFVITRYEAGNVWPAIAAAPGQRGLALHSEAELRALFLGDQLVKLAERPRSHGNLSRTHGTADLLIEENRRHG
jgi:hypothetical protein